MKSRAPSVKTESDSGLSSKTARRWLARVRRLRDSLLVLEKETKGVEGAKEACESATNALVDLKWAVEAALEKDKAEG